MAKGTKAGTQGNGSGLPKEGPTTNSRTPYIAYAAAKQGIGTAARLDDGLTEIFCQVGSGDDFNPQQVALMLNAVGKRLQSESLKLRAGIYKTPKGRESFFLP